MGGARGDPRNRLQFQSDVGTYRRIRSQRRAGSCGRLYGSHRGIADSVNHGTPRPSGLRFGIPTDSKDTLRFSELTGAPPMIENYPLAKAAEGYARMISGKAEFRVVLTM